MADKQLRQLMQEALDGNLSAEAQRQLDQRVVADPQEMAHFSGLTQVNAMLRAAPFERAPARFALRIMTRLAEEARRQQELAGDVSSLALAMSVALVTVTTMPMMVAASWLVLNAMARPDVLTRTITQVVALMTVMTGTIQQLLDEANALADTDPEAARLILALVPLTLLGFVDYLEEQFADWPGPDGPQRA